jgi:ABC-2 type transport system permease protein
MSNVLLVAKREYLEQIRGRAFRLSTLGLPALFAVIIGVAYISSLGLGANKHLVIAADDAALANAIRHRLLSDGNGKANVDVVVPARAEDRAALIRQGQGDRRGFVDREPRGRIAQGYIQLASVRRFRHQLAAQGGIERWPDG